MILEWLRGWHGNSLQRQVNVNPFVGYVATLPPSGGVKGGDVEVCQILEILTVLCSLIGNEQGERLL